MSVESRETRLRGARGWLSTRPSRRAHHLLGSMLAVSNGSLHPQATLLGGLGIQASTVCLLRTLSIKKHADLHLGTVEHLRISGLFL